MKNGKLLLRVIFLQLILVTICLYISCTEKISGTEVTNENAVCLAGKVLDMKGQGVPNIITRIDKIDLSDTTDLNGNYSLILTKDELNNLKINLDTLIDSLKIINFESIISTIKITKWIDSLPSIFLEQKDIYGSLQTSSTDFKIVAVISKLDTNKNILEQFSKDLWFNTETMGFSGFCYFPNMTIKQNYSVYVKTYNSDSIFTGKSNTVYFNQLAGDIEIPSFDPDVNPDLQISAGNDTTLTINDTLHLTAKIINHSSNLIKKWEWNINGYGFVQTSSEDTVIILPKVPSNYTCIVRATDSSNNVALSSIDIHCVQDIPFVYFNNHSGIALNKTTTIQAWAKDLGKIQKWEWNIGNIEYTQRDSTSSAVEGSSITFISPNAFTTIHCSLKVTDDDGNTRFDTVSIPLGDWVGDVNIFNTNYPLAFYKNNDFYIWGVAQYDTIDSIRFYKSDFQNSNTIGDLQLSNRTGNLQSSCISQDGSIYVAGTKGDKYNQHIELYEYKDSLWKLLTTGNLAEGDINSLSMESLGNSIYIGITLNKSQHFLYTYKANTITAINLGTYKALNRLLITKSKQNSIYICGNYTKTNDSTFYFLKEYTNGILNIISPELHIDGNIVSMFLYNDDILFGIEKDVSRVMHSGIFDSYLCKYSDNSIERFGEYLGGGSDLRLILIYQNQGNLYAVENQGQTYKLE